MSVLTKDNIITTSGVIDITWMRSEFQIVKAVSLFDIENAYTPTDIHAEIGIMSGGRSIEHRVALFNAGYCGGNAPLGWTGSYPTELGNFIYAALLGPAGHKYRLVATLWKIVADEGGRFLVDP